MGKKSSGASETKGRSRRQTVAPTAMELALKPLLAEIGLDNYIEPEQPSANAHTPPKQVSKKQKPSGKKNAHIRAAQVRSATKAKSKTDVREQQKTKAKKGRLSKKFRAKIALAREKEAMKLAGAVNEKERELRLNEKAALTNEFLKNIHSQTFTDIIDLWKKKVSFLAFAERARVSDGRKKEAEQILSTIEFEWKRRAELAGTRPDYFDWPTTKTGTGGNGALNVQWVTEGPLAYLGYHVGESSALHASNRHVLLSRIMKMQLPPIESPAYMESWGVPNSTLRLKKMANSIASFTRQAKRQATVNKSLAISQWEADLNFLHDEFYVGHFNFGWPVPRQRSIDSLAALGMRLSLKAH